MQNNNQFEDDFMIDPFKEENNQQIHQETQGNTNQSNFAKSGYISSTQPMMTHEQQEYGQQSQYNWINQSQNNINVDSYFNDGSQLAHGQKSEDEQHMIAAQSPLMSSSHKSQAHHQQETQNNIQMTQPYLDMNQQMMRTLSSHRIADNRFEFPQTQQEPNSPMGSERNYPSLVPEINNDEEQTYQNINSSCMPPSLSNNQSYKENYSTQFENNEILITQSPVLNGYYNNISEPMTRNDSIPEPLPMNYGAQNTNAKYLNETQLKEQNEFMISHLIAEDKNAPQINQMKSYMEPSKTQQILEVQKPLEKKAIDIRSENYNKNNVSESLGYEQTESKTIRSNHKFAKYHLDLKQIENIFDSQLFQTINQFDHIKDTEDYLEQMKLTIKDKKKLQKERNVKTAQLSRDRKKIELEMLRESCYKLILNLNKTRNTLNSIITKNESGLNSKQKEDLMQKFKFVFQNSEIYESDETKSQTEVSGCELSGSDIEACDNLTRSISPTEIKDNQSELNYLKYANKPGLVSKVTRVNQKQSSFAKDQIDSDTQSMASDVLSSDNRSSRKSKNKRKMKHESKDKLMIGKRNRDEREETFTIDQDQLPAQISQPSSLPISTPKSNKTPAMTWHRNKKMGTVGAAVSSVFLLATCMMAICSGPGIIDPSGNQDLDMDGQDMTHNEQFTNFGHRNLESIQENIIVQDEEEDDDEDKKKQKKKVQKTSEDEVEDESMADSNEIKNSNIDINESIISPIEQSDNKKCSMKLIRDQFDDTIHKRQMTSRPEMAALSQAPLQKPCHEKKFRSRNFLEQTYMVEQIREGFIEKEVKKICVKDSLEQQEQEQIMQNSTSSMKMQIDDEDGESVPVVYTSSNSKSPVIEVEDMESEQGVQIYNPLSCSHQETIKNIQSVNETHTTIFAPNPQVILPKVSNKQFDQNKDFDYMNFGQFDNQEEEMLIKPDSSHLHVILPAKDINVLNPSQGFQNSNFRKNKQNMDNSDLYIEIGCKIDSVEYFTKSKNNQ